MYNSYKYQPHLMNQRPSCHPQTVLLLAGVALACLTGCLTEPTEVQPYKGPTWASSVSATTPKHPDRPTGLRCTVLPQAQPAATYSGGKTAAYRGGAARIYAMAAS